MLSKNCAVLCGLLSVVEMKEAWPLGIKPTHSLETEKERQSVLPFRTCVVVVVIVAYALVPATVSYILQLSGIS